MVLITVHKIINGCNKQITCYIRLLFKILETRFLGALAVTAFL